MIKFVTYFGWRFILFVSHTYECWVDMKILDTCLLDDFMIMVMVRFWFQIVFKHVVQMLPVI